MTTRQICNIDDCTGCGACAQSCPAHAIEMRENAEGFLYPYIDEGKCINCGLCNKKCPNNHDNEKNETTFYMAWHKDDEVLKKSSSGGVFTALANIILKREGVVFGAVLDQKTRKVFHTFTENVEGIAPMRLSKYYQSEIGRSFEDVKKFLTLDRYVLFTGTACQIAGLYSYLGNKRYEKLVTMDVLCHGVTSRKVAEKYLLSQEKKYKKKIVEFQFRNKINKWQDGCNGINFRFDDDTLFIKSSGEEDEFYQGFLSNLFLRKSCTNCKYCGTQRVADITVSDFWGCSKELAAQENFEKGISVLMANSKVGKELVDELEEELLITKIDKDLVIPYNMALIRPQTAHKKRAYFFKKIDKIDYDRLLSKIFWKEDFKRGVKKFVKKMLGEKKYLKIKEKFKGGK